MIASFKDRFKSPTIPLCDGEWHRFEVLQVHDKLHIKVDEFEKTISMPSIEYVDHITLGAVQNGMDMNYLPLFFSLKMHF